MVGLSRMVSKQDLEQNFDAIVKGVDVTVEASEMSSFEKCCLAFQRKELEILHLILLELRAARIIED